MRLEDDEIEEADGIEAATRHHEHLIARTRQSAAQDAEHIDGEQPP
jgi:hypothetical protein